MKNNGWDFDNFRITKRELLASITIIAIMMLLGFVLSGNIEANQMDRDAEYYKAAKITDPEMFQYGMDTNIGNAFIYGSLEPVDIVTFPEIGGKYMYVEKVEEHYNMHTRTVTYTDSKGKTQTRTETYWSWDYAGSEEIHCQKIRFCGIEMDYSMIQMPGADYIDTINESGFVRFKYYGCAGPYSGTIYTDLRDGQIKENSKFHKNRDIEQTVQSYTSGFVVMTFWVVWIFLIAFVTFGFFYLDNRWLEE